MLRTTLEILRSALKADESITPAERTQLLAFLRNGGEPLKPQSPEKSQPRIVRRAEAAKLLGCSLRTVDLMTQQGLLAKRKWKGRKRCAGITAESLDALIATKD